MTTRLETEEEEEVKVSGDLRAPLSGWNDQRLDAQLVAFVFTHKSFQPKLGALPSPPALISSSPSVSTRIASKLIWVRDFVRDHFVRDHFDKDLFGLPLLVP